MRSTTSGLTVQFLVHFGGTTEEETFQQSLEAQGSRKEVPERSSIVD